MVAGTVACFTATIITLGYSSSLTVASYSMARIEMTAYGVLTWLAVTTLVFPRNEGHECQKVSIRDHGIRDHVQQYHV